MSEPSDDAYRKYYEDYYRQHYAAAVETATKSVLSSLDPTTQQPAVAEAERIAGAPESTSGVLRKLMEAFIRWSFILALFYRHLSSFSFGVLCLFAIFSVGLQLDIWPSVSVSEAPQTGIFSSFLWALIPGIHPLDPATSAAAQVQAAEEWQANEQPQNW